MTRSWRGFQAHERRWPSTEGVLRFIRDLVLPTPPPDLPRPNSSAAPVLNPPPLPLPRAVPSVAPALGARAPKSPTAPRSRACFRVHACNVKMLACWPIPCECCGSNAFSSLPVPYLEFEILYGYDIKVKWTIYMLVCYFTNGYIIHMSYLITPPLNNLMM